MSHILRRPAIYLLIACAFVAHAAFYSASLGFDVVDDAYISFRYARNVARGGGLTFNVGERPVEGYTSFLWTVGLVPVFLLGWPGATAAALLGLLSALGCFVLLARRVVCLWLPARFAGAVGSNHGRGVWLAAAATLFLAADGSFALWAVGGLETALFSLLLLAGALAYVHEVEHVDAPVVSGVWFALAALARPEGVLVYGVTLAHRVVLNLARRQKPFMRQDGQRFKTFAMIWGTWFVTRWCFYGFPLPNTFYVKVSLVDAAVQWRRGWTYAQTFVGVHLGPLLFAMALLPLLRRRWRVWSSYFVLLVGLYSVYIVYVGGDWSVGRFFAPLLPFFYTLLAAGLFVVGEWVEDRWPAGWRRPRTARTVVAVAVVVGIAGGLFVRSSLDGAKARFVDAFDARLMGRARTAMGRWLHENMPRDTYIAVDAAGQIPFYADLRTLDLYGLNDLVIAHSRVERMAQTTPGHQKMDMAYVIFVARPDYIIVYGSALDWLSAFSYQRAAWRWTDDPTLEAVLSVYERQ